MALSIGYSPCPNDTYIFYALVHGLIPLTSFALDKPQLEDVETLNAWAMQGRLDVTKLSFHALGYVLDQYSVLQSGAALGRGCGPLLITGKQAKPADMKNWTIAIPGNYTTAAMLLKLYAPEVLHLQEMRFEQIIPAVAEGKVDGGVIIHESRFTYQEQGLECVQDLGQWWEDLTGLPLPLGCIAAKRSLSAEVVEELDLAIKKSLEWTRAHPTACTTYIQRYAQELDDEVVSSHIGLYVNDFSLGLGAEGVAAVEELLRRGVDAGVFADPGSRGWQLSR
ncbi:MAG: 1,4-dihydroxy-6-naphthoate synthase [Desulfobacterales bacterium]|nr:MAG: 1,4-dihydroxy-6-naphthoate synthase [Desulfobacterales bacterium]